MKILHVIRSNDDSLSSRIVKEIAGNNGVVQTLLLIQDGVYAKPAAHLVFACSDDVAARGVETDVPLVDYDRIVEMVFEHDKVITW